MASHDGQAPLYVSHFLPQLFNKKGINSESHFFIAINYGTVHSICHKMSLPVCQYFKTPLALYLSLLPLFCSSVLLLQIRSFFVLKVSSVPFYHLEEIKMLHSVLDSEELHAMRALVKFAGDSVNAHISFLS